MRGMDYKRAFDRLLNDVVPSTQVFSDLKLLQSRLNENLETERLYGTTETIRSDRAQIINSINRITLAEMGRSLSDYADAKEKGDLPQNTHQISSSSSGQNQNVPAPGDRSTATRPAWRLTAIVLDCILLLGSLIWLWTDPSFEPALALFGSILAIVFLINKKPRIWVDVTFATVLGVGAIALFSNLVIEIINPNLQTAKMIDGFDPGRRVAIWNPDGCIDYQESDLLQKSGNNSLEIQFKKEPTCPFAFIGFELPGTAQDQDFSNHSFLMLYVHGTVDLLVKLEGIDGSGDSIEVELGTMAVESPTGWSELNFDLKPALQLVAVEKVLIFPYPGDSNLFGSFFIDDIQLQK